MWAQYSELLGALTTPTRSSKTVICGNSASMQTINRVLNVLTYFIRSCEIKRHRVDKYFDLDRINHVSIKQSTFTKSQFSTSSSKTIMKKQSPRLLRATSAVKNLNFLELINTNESKEEYNEVGDEKLLSTILKKNVMNDIPKVLAFRDSRMVMQELRIGNKSMDTGLERTQQDREFLKKYIKNEIKTRSNVIKLTVTTPDSDEALELNERSEKKMNEVATNCKDQSHNDAYGVEKNEMNLTRSQVEFILGENEELIRADIDNQNRNQSQIHHHSSKSSQEYSEHIADNIYFDDAAGPPLFVEPKMIGKNYYALSVIELPLLESIELSDEEQEKIKPGFTLSLFPLATDHYISDMILQGCTSSPIEWEQALRRDLYIKSKTDGIESVAIIANIEKNEVRIAASSNSNGVGIVGMSNLVCQMLETVQVR